MSNEITAYKIHSAGVILRGVKCLDGADKDSLVHLLFDIAAQVAEREQSQPVCVLVDWNRQAPDALFVEVETPEGKSISVPWHDRVDGLKELHLFTEREQSPTASLLTTIDGAPVAVHGTQASIDTLRERLQSPAVDQVRDARAQHAAMVSKLRDVRLRLADPDECDPCDRWLVVEIDAILSAEPTIAYIWDYHE